MKTTRKFIIGGTLMTHPFPGVKSASCWWLIQNNSGGWTEDGFDVVLHEDGSILLNKEDGMIVLDAESANFLFETLKEWKKPKKKPTTSRKDEK